MKRRTFLAVIGLLVVAALARAQDGRKSDFSGWRWFLDVKGPQEAPAGNLAFLLPPEVFGKAEPSLDDLRLADSSGVPVPFALQVLRADQKETTVPLVREFDAGPSPKNRFYETRLELNLAGAPGYNDIDIQTTGTNFRRKVEVFGDSTDQFEDPRPLLDGVKEPFLVRYQTEQGLVNVQRFRFPFKQFRFLMVRVYADPSNGETIPKIMRITVRRTIVVPGEYLTRRGDLGPREAVRGDGGPGSAWFIDLGGDRIPCERLRLRSSSDAAERPYRIQIADPDQPRRDILQTDWQWRKEGEQQVLQISFPEVAARRLRLVVTDFANEPLILNDVETTSAARRIVFELPPARNYALPLRLYVGNSQAGPARYDFAQRLPPILTPPPTEVPTGAIHANPAYQPPPLPLSERAPWLIYVILAVACAILLAILLLLARRAHARQVVRESPT